ncbi:unnamed protein product [Peniophora sp. CBMAI 1063]|nr:unnamed protein product [Peniophora sp. CBMAI 1063]
MYNVANTHRANTQQSGGTPGRASLLQEIEYLERRKRELEGTQRTDSRQDAAMQDGHVAHASQAGDRQHSLPPITVFRRSMSTLSSLTTSDTTNGPSHHSGRSLTPDHVGDTGVPVGQELGNAKLSIKHFAEANPQSIWYTACNMDIPAIVLGNVEYEIGDVILYRNIWMDSTLEASKVLPEAWPAILCDVSMGNPFSGGSKRVPCPVRSQGSITHVALMWLYSRYVIGETISGNVENHSHIDYVNEAEFRETFLDPKVPERQQFLSTEREWMSIDDLCGHLDPRDVGADSSSQRPIFVNWSGPVVGHSEQWRRKNARNDALWHTYAVNEKSGIEAGELPEGWVHEG